MHARSVRHAVAVCPPALPTVCLTFNHRMTTSDSKSNPDPFAAPQTVRKLLYVYGTETFNVRSDPNTHLATSIKSKRSNNLARMNE